MSGDSTSLVGRLMDRVFPIMPDFFRMMCDQCDVAVKATAALSNTWRTAVMKP